MVNTLKTPVYFTVVLIVLLVLQAHMIWGAEKTNCSTKPIFAIKEFPQKEIIEIKARKNKATLNYQRVLSKFKITDEFENDYYFMTLSLGGNCGEFAGLVTAYQNNIMVNTLKDDKGFDECSDGWKIIAPGKILGNNIIKWSGLCGIDTCRACDPRYPVVWTIRGCDNNGIHLRMLSFEELLSLENGKEYLGEFFGYVRERIVKDKVNLISIKETKEKRFCESLIKKADSETLITLFRKLSPKNR